MRIQRFRWTAFLSSSVVCNVATLGPLGYLGKAPGTVGSIAGVLWYSMFFSQAGPLQWLLLLAGSIYLAAAFCGEAELRLNKKDPGEIILDEVVAVPVCFLGLVPATYPLPSWLLLLIGFGLFRFFDIQKPLVISRLQNYPGGWGVVLDDLGAAVATCACLHLLALVLSVAQGG